MKINLWPQRTSVSSGTPNYCNMKFPTVQEQIDYWNTKERLEHERVMNIRAESRDATNETRDAGCTHQYIEQGGGQQCGVRCIKCGDFVGAWE